MPSHASSSSSGSSEVSKNIDSGDEWQDAEPDEEKVIFQCLFGKKTFGDIQSFLEHCKQIHDFDLAHIRSELGL